MAGGCRNVWTPSEQRPIIYFCLDLWYGASFLSFDTVLKICPTAVMANYSLCLADMKRLVLSWLQYHHNSQIPPKTLRKWIRTIVSVLKGKYCYEALIPAASMLVLQQEKRSFLLVYLFWHLHSILRYALTFGASLPSRMVYMDFHRGRFVSSGSLISF